MESKIPSASSDPQQEVMAARSAAADRLVTPRWHYPVLGLLVAQHVFVQGLDEPNWTLPSFVLLIGGAVGLVLTHRRVIGLSVAGPRGVRSRILLALLSLTAAGCITIAAVADSTAVASIAACAALAATLVLGLRYDAALRDDVRGS